MNSYSLQRYPFLRLLVPLAAGIACGDTFPQEWPIAIVIGIGLLLIPAYALCNRQQLLPVFGIIVNVFFFTLGHQVMSQHIIRTLYPFPPEANTWEVKLTTQPEEKNNSLLLEAVLEKRIYHDTIRTIGYPVSILLYFPKDSVSHSLQRGDRLLIHTRLSRPTPNGNPCEFNYPRYLLHKGISGTGYVSSRHWKVMAHDSTRTIAQTAADYRRQIINLYRQLGFSGDELAVLSALTVGDKSELSEEISETYAATGASHVLALSGLHIGLLYALCWYLMSPLWRRRHSLKPLCLLSIVMVMWLFALLTGLSSSVVRSVCMFSLLTVASLRSDRILTFNSLAATAFLMLFIHPAWLFDVGFQLSFCAVSGILLLKPGLDRIYRPRNKIMLKIRDLVNVSLSAQAAVSPLLMFYFARFSTHFLLTNLLIVPFVTLIMYAALLLLLLSPLPGLQILFAPVVELLIRCQHTVLHFIEELPASTIDHISLHPVEVTLMFVACLLLAHYLSLRTAPRLIALLSCLLVLTAAHTASQYYNRPHTAITFYNYRSCPAVHLLTDSNRSWLVYAASTTQHANGLQRSLAGYWNRMQLATPEVVRADSTLTGEICLSHNMLFYAGKRIYLLNDNRWHNTVASVPYFIDYLYLSKGFSGNIKQLTDIFSIKQIILDSSLPAYLRQRLGNECQQLNIPCHDLQEEGYLQISL